MGIVSPVASPNTNTNIGADLPTLDQIIGDLDDNGYINLADVEFLIDYIFRNGDYPEPLEIGDFNKDGIVDVGDPVAIIAYLKANGIKGDVNSDLKVDLDDVNYLIDYIFKHGPEPIIFTTGDFNEDGQINVGDPVAIIAYLKANGFWDSETPIINLIYPEKDDVIKTNKDPKEIHFEYEVEDDSEIDYCILIIDGNEVETDNEVIKEDLNVFQYDLDRGEEYLWKIKCVDVYGNEQTSEERELEIKKKTSVNFPVIFEEEKEESFNYYSEDTKVIDLTSDSNNFKINIGFLLPVIFGFLCLIVLLIIIVIAISRRN